MQLESSSTRRILTAVRAIKRSHKLLLAAAGVALCLALSKPPDPLFDGPYSSILLARDDTLISAQPAADSNWHIAPSREVSEKFIRALNARADRGKLTSADGTLAMHVVRLARKDRPRTAMEKIKQALLAARLELRYGRSEILELFAAHAPFGANTFGVEAAAWRYLGSSAQQMSWADAATLAVIQDSPELLDSATNRAVLQRKRDALLHRLHTEHALTAPELQAALREPLSPQPRPLPHQAVHLFDTLQADKPAGARIETTLEASLQRSVEAIVARHHTDLSKQGIGNTAVLVIDNRTFEVLAYIGDAPASVGRAAGEHTDFIRRPRSTAGLLKPLLFASMLQEGEVLPTTLMPDIPSQYGGFAPENPDRAYRGAVPAQAMLAPMIDIPAVHMLSEYGVPRFHALLVNAGVTSADHAAEDYGLTVILGGAEASLWDLSGVYANLADITEHGTPGRTGYYRRPKVLRTHTISTERERDIGPGAAWLTMQALIEVNRFDTNRLGNGYPAANRIAWIGSTSIGQRDAWAIGSTPRYTVGVWVGNANGEGRASLRGVDSAAPIMFAVFKQLGHAAWFRKPEVDLRPIEVCRNDGYLPSGGCDTELQWTAADSHFDKVSPHHLVVHLDARHNRRVTGQCEAPERMRHASWFVLPAAQEKYFKRHNSRYRNLPEYRADCATDAQNGPLDLLNPDGGAPLYIPMDREHNKGQTILEAVHRDPQARLHWKLNGRDLGRTAVYHQQVVDIEPGSHTVTVADERGNFLSRRFEVQGRDTPPAAPRTEQP